MRASEDVGLGQWAPTLPWITDNQGVWYEPVMHKLLTLIPASCLALLSSVACSSSNDSGIGGLASDAGVRGDAAASPIDSGPAPTTPTGPDALAGCTRDPGAPAPKDIAGATDPTGGADKFTLAQALEGFPSGAGTLTAAITTEKGIIKCNLGEGAAPVSVANFVGLARGTRPYRATGGRWKTGRFYDGKIWHRVIPNFVIQGGDPLGTGTGGPGYDLPVENHAAQVKGALSMAASSVPSGSQFYIVIGKGPANEYNVFGQCETEAATAIAAVEVDGNDRPKTPVHMQKIEIARCP